MGVVILSADGDFRITTANKTIPMLIGLLQDFLLEEKNYKRNLVKKLNTAMRDKLYKAGFWKKETGKTIDQLWTAYSVNPGI